MARRIFKSVGWSLAILGVFLGISAFRCRAYVRWWQIRSGEFSMGAEIDPAEVEFANWRTIENDVLTSQTQPNIIISVNRIFVVTGVVSREENQADRKTTLSVASSSWVRGNFGYVHGYNSPPFSPSLVDIWFPSWLTLLLLFLPLAVQTAHKVRRKRKGEQGLCEKCGYDLRGTPQRCPECGTVPGMGKGRWEKVTSTVESMDVTFSASS